jgi:hypothetical protein
MVYNTRDRWVFGALSIVRLALSKGPDRVGAPLPPTPEDGNRSSFRNVVSFRIQKVFACLRIICLIFLLKLYSQNYFQHL